MATNSLGRLTLDLLVKLGSFEQGMNAAERKAKQSAQNMSNAFKGFNDQIQQMIGGTALGSVIDTVSTKLGAMRGGVLLATSALAGMAIGGTVVAVGGLSAMAVELAKSNMELIRFATLANTSIQTFQGLAGAAATYGVNQEQLSDMLKDFNEKIGEFASVGGGEAKDFFEQIAVKTEKGADGAKKLAAEMSKMDGIAALQTYVDKLEEAGVNQQQLSFYLENMGNDFTKLAPLLVNGGELWRDYQKAMEEAGVITGQEAIEKSIILAAQTESLQMRYMALKNQLAETVMPALSGVISYFVDGSGKGGQFAGIIDAVGIAAKGTAVLIITLSAGIKSVVQLIAGALNVIGNFGQTVVNFATAPTLLSKGKALVDGFVKNGNILVDTAKSVKNSVVDGYTSASGILSNQKGQYDSLTQSIINNRKAQMEWAKLKGKGVTSGIAENKALNPKAKSTKEKKDNSAEKARREQEQIERAQQSIILQYSNEETKLLLKYQEDSKKIREAFAKDPTTRDLYLQKAKETYDRDLAAYRQAQKEKYESFKNDFMSKLADAQDAIALSSIANKYGQGTFEYQVASLNVSSRKSKDQELDAYTNSVNQINKEYDSPEMASQRYQLLEQAKAAHIEKMKSLDLDYRDNAKMLIEDQHSATLSMYSSLLSQAGSVWGDMTQMVKDSAGEQSGAYKAMFLMQQMFAIGSALVSTHLAAAQVMADPTALTMAQKATYSSLILGMGYANVGLIAAQTVAGLAGYSEGGYTGQGGKYEPAGIVHRGEVVFSQADIARLGGVGVVESMRLGHKGYADGGIVGDTKVLNVNQTRLNSDLSGQPTINVYTLPGETADVTQNSDGSLDVKIRKIIDEHVPSAMSNPSSRISKSMSQNYAIKRQR
ncbi:phage tail tape measure protein [Acinetobacter soli]|uniref:phage tail tape measure protein n=1 Tax=Acinetobacter soli TaxID=487316 RepID=UPI001D18314E|nr:phage tail tape measure protein [Acinetobacter soli]